MVLFRNSCEKKRKQKYLKETSTNCNPLFFWGGGGGGGFKETTIRPKLASILPLVHQERVAVENIMDMDNLTEKINISKKKYMRFL